MKPKTVLIVDDSADDRTIYRTLFEHLGYHIVVAADGRECLRLVAAHKPDLVLLDLALPALDGWEVAERLRRSATTTSLPIIALTARLEPDNEQRAESLELDEFLTKPIDPRRVADAVRRIIGHPAG